MTLLQRQIAFIHLLRRVKRPGERPGETIIRALKALDASSNRPES